MKEHVAPIVESLGPVAADVPDPPPNQPTPRLLLLTGVFQLGLSATYFATSLWPRWQADGASTGSAVATIMAGGLFVMGASRVRAYRRACASTARSARPWSA
jgi:hypothetical protein